MRERVAPLGDKNIVGATVTRLRLEQGITQKALMAKMQTFGADISYSSLSKLEGQTRSVSDKSESFKFVTIRLYNVTVIDVYDRLLRSPFTDGSKIRFKCCGGSAIV